MPVIKVEMFEGRTTEQRRALCLSLTKAFIEAVGGAPESVQILFVDASQGDWAVAGNPCSERAAAAAAAALEI
jgi:4-oxalocrotonate tautomerase